MDFEGSLINNSEFDLWLEFSFPQKDNSTLDDTDLSVLYGSLMSKCYKVDENMTLIFEMDSRGTVGPPIQEISETSFTSELTFLVPPSESTTIRVLCKVNGDIRSSRKIEIPAYDVFKFADKVTHESGAGLDVQWITKAYEIDSISRATFEFLNDISPWVRLNDHLRIQNAIARESDQFQQYSKGIHYFLANQITNADQDRLYEINSMEELDQVITLSEYLDHLPPVDKYKILETTLRLIDQSQEFDYLWNIEQKFDLGRTNWRSLLWTEQMTTILAKSLIENEFNRARQLAENWVGGPTLDWDELQAAIDKNKQAPQDEAHIQWRELIGSARDAPDQEFSYVVLQYLYSYQRNIRINLYLLNPIWKAIEITAESLGIERLAKEANYNTHLTQGQLHSKKDQFEAALNSFDRALEIALEIKNESEDNDHIQTSWALYWRKASEADNYSEQDELEKAISVVEEGLELLDALNTKGEKSTKEYCRSRLEAKYFEFRGDQSLGQDRLEEALRHYGKAINSYQTVDREEESSYLVQRRGLIQASLAEQEGDFVRAKKIHNRIADQTDDRSFKHFNHNRGQVCHSKEKLLNREFKCVRETIEPILKKKSFSSIEAKYLTLLINLLETYEENDIVNIRKTLDNLEELPELAEATEEYPFKYGHDYRPAFVNILAAQRLRMAGVDPTLLDQLVDISIRHVLAPARADQVIEELQMEEIGLQERWKLHFPSHIVSRFQEIEAGKITNRGNFADQALSQLKLVEQALEFVASYYGPRYFGEGWREHATDRNDHHLTLQELRNFLNTEATEDCVWNEPLKNAIDRELIGGDDLIDARNMLGHDRKAPRLNEEEYRNVKERVVNVFVLLDSELPIIGEIESTHELGSYMVSLKWENPQKWCYLNFEEDLGEGTIYYLPPESLEESIVVSPKRGEVIKCRSDRVLENVAAYDKPVVK